MKSTKQFITNGILCLLFLFSVNFCKHDKKNSDQDLFFLLQALAGYSPPGPSPEWVRLLGAPGSTLINSNAITSDSNNNVYVTGDTNVNIDGQNKTGAKDGFLTKFSTKGIKQWTILFGVTLDYTTANGVSSDTSNNLYVVGSTTGSLDGETFIGTPDFSFRNLFIVKFDSNGTRQWTRLLGVAGDSSIATGVTTDSANNVYITGSSVSGLDGQTYSGGGIGYFIIKYSSAGTKQWTKLFPGQRPTGIIFNNSTNKIYLTGFTSTSIDGQTISGSTDAYLIQLDSNGNKLWTKLFGSAGQMTNSNSIALDNQGNLYLSGSATGSLDGQTKSQGGNDLLISKFDSSGNRIWTRLLGFYGNFFIDAHKNAVGTGISITQDQTLYAAGYTNGNLDGQTNSDQSGSDKNLFLTKYDLDGNKKWTTLLGQKGSRMEIFGLTTDTQGRPYITGTTTGPLKGETYIGTPITSTNLFIVKY
ncbi:SBBP repeat-containing protein [Leptospira kmetyi]|uniref:Beta-propeller repeat protein n=1 Tax=Leptospira kmetyi TaxID=408139 RepID=A0ABX4N4S9_9LEPT|nr:SBBP repeat-containing protein [Leptospira kmetyi]PJZ28326.1 hypothetical protein CH378_18585 [Leptospira kmetyi]